MKKVIIVSYHFPPYGGKAVQRASKLAKYLPEFGWKPVIFTMPLDEHGVPVDYTLLEELPLDIEIYRPPFRNWRKLIPYSIRKHLFSPLPDGYRYWIDAVENRLIQIIKTKGTHALITTSPTHSAHLLGLRAKLKTGIPWVADFRDPWTGHPDFSAKKHADKLRIMETVVIKMADAIVGVVPNILSSFTERVPSEKLFLIENGYDEDDFKDIPTEFSVSHEALWIGYNGTVSEYHNPTPLLESVASLLASGSIKPGDIHITFTTDKRGNKWFPPFAHLIKSGILKVQEYLPHTESITWLSKMDVLLLLVTKGKDIYTGKVFEYFYLGDPILALGTSGDDLDRLLRETHSGTITDYRDPAVIKQTILDLLEKKKSGKLARLPQGRQEIQKFSRRNIARRYAELLDELTVGESAISSFHKQGR